jgi:hypothetical protein
MRDLVAALGSSAVCALVLWGLVRVAVRVRRSGSSGGALMQPFDEIWHPVAHRARLEVEVQQELPAPGPTAGDRLV